MTAQMLFFSVFSQKNPAPLTCSGVNINGPGRFRTKADNPDKQVRHFIAQNDDQLFDFFVSKGVNKKEQLAVSIFKLKELEVRLTVQQSMQKFF